MWHAWDVKPSEAKAIQKELRKQVKLTPLTKEIKIIGGVDVSMERFGTELYAGIILLSYPELEVLTYSVAHKPITFPYIPGYLSFREIPALLETYEKLSIKPDLLIVDGHGIAHPRRLGIAAHLGVLLNIPTIGCGKSKLIGTYTEPGLLPGDISVLKDKDEVIGTVLRSKARSNPLFISPGHRITHEEALNVIQHCLQGYRLPEPTRLAHELVNKFRRGEIKGV